MEVALSELKVNVDKYVELAETTDVIITKHGKPAAKIIRFDNDDDNLSLEAASMSSTDFWNNPDDEVWDNV